MKIYNDEEKGQHELFVIIDIWQHCFFTFLSPDVRCNLGRDHQLESIFIHEEHSREMVMKRKNEDEEELDVSKAAKLDPPPEEVHNLIFLNL